MEMGWRWTMDHSSILQKLNCKTPQVRERLCTYWRQDDGTSWWHGRILSAVTSQSWNVLISMMTVVGKALECLGHLWTSWDIWFAPFAPSAGSLRPHLGHCAGRGSSRGKESEESDSAFNILCFCLNLFVVSKETAEAKLAKTERQLSLYWRHLMAMEKFRDNMRPQETIAAFDDGPKRRSRWSECKAGGCGGCGFFLSLESDDVRWNL